MNIYAGMLLAELNSDYTSQSATTLLPRTIPPFIILVGLFLSSFPDENPAWRPWSSYVNHIFAVHLTPPGAEINRYIVSVGATITIYGIFLSRSARTLLAHPVMNFLGKISFPLYLLHNTLMRTALAWLIYGPSAIRIGLNATDEEGNPVWLERGGWIVFCVGMPVFYMILIYVAYLWTKFVEPGCERVVSWGVKLAFDQGGSVNSKLVREGQLQALNGIGVGTA
jgi:peptidoglycan/LPS O-acetylase OafA/YrhL